MLVMAGCTSALLGTAVVGSSITDERTVGAQIDDVAITSKITARLAAEKDMPSRWISVDSIQGKVSLMGYLSTQEQINRAIFIAKSFQGVKSVRSEIKVGEPALKNIMTDSWITTKVKTNLLKNKKTSGVAVHVETIDGRVYLQGVVRNDEQYKSALELTSKVKGVREVVDMLEVNPYGTANTVQNDEKMKRLTGSRKQRGVSLQDLREQTEKKSKQIDAEKTNVSEKSDSIVVREESKGGDQEDDHPEVIALPMLDREGDIFEETVSGIRHKHKKEEPVLTDQYDDHSDRALHPELSSEKDKHQVVHRKEEDTTPHSQAFKNISHTKIKPKNDDDLKSSEKNGLSQKNTLQ